MICSLEASTDPATPKGSPIRDGGWVSSDRDLGRKEEVGGSLGSRYQDRPHEERARTTMGTEGGKWDSTGQEEEVRGKGL